MFNVSCPYCNVEFQVKGVIGTAICPACCRPLIVKPATVVAEKVSEWTPEEILMHEG